jgi:hypothetical protein
MGTLSLLLRAQSRLAVARSRYYRDIQDVLDDPYDFGGEEESRRHLRGLRKKTAKLRKERDSLRAKVLEELNKQ